MTNWWTTARDAVRAQLWPVPTFGVVLALVLGLVLPRIDEVLDPALSPTWSDVLFGGDADAARSLLGAVSSSLINVTALTFSLTVVTLQLASSQFSPRLLRTFASDGFVQATLAMFLGTFTYALTVLRSVRSSSEAGAAEFVPQVAVSVSFLLAVVSVLGLVLFLAHLVRQIRVETMLRDVHRDATATIDAVLHDRSVGSRQVLDMPSAPASAIPVPAPVDGFVTSVDHHSLLHAAVTAGAMVRLEVHPGTFVVSGTPLGLAWPVAGGGMAQEASDELVRAVAGSVQTGPERTAAQDVGLGLRQLSDVANKALSPGINDPTTAIHALAHVSALLCTLAQHDLGPVLLHDDDGHVRVVARRPDFAAYVELGVAQPRRYGANDPDVLAQLFRVLHDLAHRVPVDELGVVRAQLDRLRGTVADQGFDSTERATLAAAHDEVDGVLRSRAHPGAAHPGRRP